MNRRDLYTLDRAPELPSGIISLMFPAERDLLYSIAKHYCTGAGAIVDAGIFMGASTFCFASGLRDNQQLTDEPAIHSYDRAIVDKGMVNYPGVMAAIGEAGTDFSDYLRRTIEPFGRHVTLHIGDIMEETNSGLSEVVFFDVLKSHDIMRHCNRIFLGSLIPGRTLLIQQDHFWPENWYINAYMEAAADWFELVDSAESSAVFLNTSRLPPKMYWSDPLNGLSRIEITALLERAAMRSTTLFQYVMSELCTIAFQIGAGAKPTANLRMAALEAGFANVLQSWASHPSKRRALAWYRHLSRMISS